MSGIAGIIHFGAAPVESGLLQRMTSAMAYRGPDGINHWIQGSVGLGQCMLRTTPESLHELQPLTDEDSSLVLVMDGRVDNWEELRRDLLGRGAMLRNRSDAELALRAYQFWGKDCLARIDGDFALVIWDARRQTAFCARDRMGNKPFNYHWSGSTLAFASELHPILTLPWVPRTPNEGMLAEYLTDTWYSRDETLWRGILRLVAAHNMEVDIHGPRTEQYWEPDLWTALPYKKDEEYFEHYRELLRDVVRRLSRSHRRVAVDVSGGLDSSAVFCMAERLRRSQQLPAPGIQGYTLAFTDDSEADELEYARAVGKYLGAVIHEVPPSIMPLAWYEVRARSYRDFPGYPNASMFIGMRERAASDGSRVVLTGEGGDDFLQGSRAYYGEELAQWHLATLFNCLWTDAAEFGAGQALKWLGRHGLYPRLPSALRTLLRPVWRLAHPSVAREPYWLSREMQQTIRHRRSRWGRGQNTRMRSQGQGELLSCLYDAFSAIVMERIERESAHWGLEMRHPLSHHSIVQFACSTPERLRLRGSTTKLIHRRALQDIMPPLIRDRQDKADFSNTFQRQLDAMPAALRRTIPEQRWRWLSPQGMDRLFRSYQGKPCDAWQMWILWGLYGCGHALKLP